MAKLIINQRGKTWQYRFGIGNGKYASKSGYATKKEAQAAGTLALATYENGGTVQKPNDISLGEFLDFWMENEIKVKRKQATFDNYEKKIRLYIKNEVKNAKLKSGEVRKNLAVNDIDLADYELKKATANVLEKFLQGMYNQGFSVNTISTVRGILSKSLQYAVKQSYILQNPAIDLEFETDTQEIETRQEPHVNIEKSQWEMIMDRFSVDSVAYLPLMLGYRCGLRLAETYGLTWGDIDLENGTLTVNRQVQWYQDKNRSKDDKKASNGSKESGNGFWYFTPPKFNSYRTIDLDEELLEILRAKKEQQDKDRAYYGEHYSRYFSKFPVRFGEIPSTEKYNPVSDEAGENEIMFVMVRDCHTIGNGSCGSYITARTMQHTSRVIHHDLGFKEFDYHSLRHTHATMLRANGAPEIYISKRLGHKRVEITMELYANHLTDIDITAGHKVLQGML